MESSDPGEHRMHNSVICIVLDPPDTAAISRMVTIWSGYAYKIRLDRYIPNRWMEKILYNPSKKLPFSWILSKN